MNAENSQNNTETFASKDANDEPSGSDTMNVNHQARASTGSYKAIAGVAFVFSLIALLASGFIWYSTVVTGRLELTEALTRAEFISKEFDALRSSNLKVMATQHAVQGQINDDRRELESELRLLNTKTKTEISRIDEQQATARREFREEFDTLVRSMESTRQEVGKGTDDWLLEEISQLLNLANERLLLNGDVALALRAFELAQERIAELQDPALLTVRRQLATDIAMMSAIPMPDLHGIVLQLSILIQQVSDLPLAGEVIVADFTQSSQEINKSPGMDNTLTRLGRRLIKDLSALVRIREIETTQLPNLGPDQRFFIYESVRSPLNAALLALLRGLPAVYSSSLERAQVGLMNGFDDRFPVVIEFRLAIEQLATVELADEYPDISKPIGMLREIIRMRSRPE